MSLNDPGKQLEIAGTLYKRATAKLYEAAILHIDGNLDSAERSLRLARNFASEAEAITDGICISDID